MTTKNNNTPPTAIQQIKNYIRDNPLCDALGNGFILHAILELADKLDKLQTKMAEQKEHDTCIHRGLAARLRAFEEAFPDIALKQPTNAQAVINNNRDALNPLSSAPNPFSGEAFNRDRPLGLGIQFPKDFDMMKPAKDAPKPQEPFANSVLDVSPGGSITINDIEPNAAGITSFTINFNSQMKFDGLKSPSQSVKVDIDAKEEGSSHVDLSLAIKLLTDYCRDFEISKWHKEQVQSNKAAISILQKYQKENNKDCPLSTMPYSHFKKMEKEIK
jgi:hypothetical protein